MKESTVMRKEMSTTLDRKTRMYQGFIMKLFLKVREPLRTRNYTVKIPPVRTHKNSIERDEQTFGIIGYI